MFIYTGRNLHATVLSDFSSIPQYIEEVFVNIIKEIREKFVACSYTPPSNYVEDFIIDLDTLLQYVNTNVSAHRIILAGDVNIIVLRDNTGQQKFNFFSWVYELLTNSEPILSP